MKRLIPFVLLIGMSLPVSSQNLVVNPGFETWQKANKPDGWTTALGCLKDSLIINTGLYSCRQSTTNDSKELAQIVSVSPGDQYILSFYYKNDTSATGNGCRVWSVWKDEGGAVLDDPATEPLLKSKYLKSNTWEQYTAEITAPDAASYLSLVIRTLPNSVTYWDDIVFEENVATYNNEILTSEIRIYPNPVHDYLYISNIQNIQHIDILTITGIVVWSSLFAGDQFATIPVSGLTDGMYIIKLNSCGKTVIRKFIKTGR